MSDNTPYAFFEFDGASSMQMGPDLVASLATIALIQARIVVDELQNTVIPFVPPTRRTFPSTMLKRLERSDIFQLSFLADLETLSEMVERQVEAGSHVGWEADVNHTRGGYEVIYYEDGIAPLARAVGELDVLAKAVIKTISAARALRSVGELLDA